MSPLSDSRNELFDHVASLTLPQCPRFALLGIIAFTQLELGNLHGAILAIALRLLVVGETATQDCQLGLDDGGEHRLHFSSPVVEIHSTLNRRPAIYGRSQGNCSANFELLVRLTLNYLCFDSRNSELPTANESDPLGS